MPGVPVLPRLRSEGKADPALPTMKSQISGDTPGSKEVPQLLNLEASSPPPLDRARGSKKQRRRPSGRRRLRGSFSNLQRLLYPVAGWIILSWVWTINRLVPVDRRGPAFDFVRDGRPFIFTFWHEDCFPLMFDMSRSFRQNPPVFMVSLGRTGSIGAYLLTLFNVESVAGSGAKKGIRAVKQLAKRGRRRGETIYILADGSRGPNKEARWGAVHLARDSGLPIIAGRAWGTSMICLWWTWMKLVLPLPWGRQVVLTSEPLYVPPEADKEELQRCREELQRRLDDLCEASVDYFRKGQEAADPFGSPVDPFPIPRPAEATSTD